MVQSSPGVTPKPRFGPNLHCQTTSLATNGQTPSHALLGFCLLLTRLVVWQCRFDGAPPSEWVASRTSAKLRLASASHATPSAASSSSATAPPSESVSARTSEDFRLQFRLRGTHSLPSRRSHAPSSRLQCANEPFSPRSSSSTFTFKVPCAPKWVRGLGVGLGVRVRG